MPMVISKCGELMPEFDIDTSTGQHRRQGQGPAWEASCVGQGLGVSWSGCEGVIELTSGVRVDSGASWYWHNWGGLTRKP